MKAMRLLFALLVPRQLATAQTAFAPVSVLSVAQPVVSPMPVAPLRGLLEVLDGPSGAL